MNATPDVLRQLPLFALLGHEQLEAIVASGHMRHVEPGEALFRRGDPGDALFVVEQGELRVNDRDEHGVVELRVVGSGGYVGEIAVLDGQPRSASVSSATSSDLFVVPRAEFLALLQSNPDLMSTVLSNLTQTVRGHTQRLFERERQQRELRTEMELARHRALTRMVAGVAHEINTPLGIVSTAASVVTTRVGSDALRALAANPDSRQALDDIQQATDLRRRNVERAHRLVQQFKSLSVGRLRNTEVFDAAAGEVREALGDAAFEATWAEGRDMTLDETVAYALPA